MTVLNKKEFIIFVAEHAKNDWVEYGILPSITIAQAILESMWGTSLLATNANNLFGIKGNHNGYAYAKVSKEETAEGKMIDVESYFRHYPDWAASIKDHGEFLNSTPWRKNHYSSTLGEADYQKAAKGLAKTYATDSEYGVKLIGIIEEHKLTQFDPVAKGKDGELYDLKKGQVIIQKELYNINEVE